ncbi:MULTISPECIES: hypothetical protein [Bacillaceae]|uniref:Uncharacterized protein n=1 Tax=Evansella alkalicola TaxID=745819 RepID=A0ABS6K0Y0_9BACI|nr:MULTISPECIES: hypothetical protein [Bacillaceae]MBU9723961.1 hypothetical protein [Bacillus alkalicola]
MRLLKTGIISLFTFLLLTGCLYPDERRIENSVPYSDQLQAVENAVLQYRQDYGAVPVKTREEDTPIFRRYPINFTQLVPGYLQSAPGNSFENGGVFQYVLIHPERMPEVKLIDLRVSREIQNFHQRILEYRRTNNFAPVNEAIGDGILSIDFKALNYDNEPAVSSPFHSDHKLPLLMQTDGEIIVDYSMDIMHYINEYGMGEYVEGDDLRWLLVDHSPFVPVNSLPQTMKDGEIVFMSGSESIE